MAGVTERWADLKLSAASPGVHGWLTVGYAGRRAAAPTLVSVHRFFLARVGIALTEEILCDCEPHSTRMTAVISM
jgi:hypothetical protein